MAFVGYRDFEDGPAEVKPFTQDVDDVISFIDRQQAFGGGDFPEDLAGGLADALKLDWVSKTRTLVIIADAPCHGEKYHGSKYHGSIYEDYPQGDPTGLSMNGLLQTTRRSLIDVTLVQLSDATDEMQRLLKQYYEAGAGPDNLNTFELRDLCGIIKEVGGINAIGDGSAAHVSTILSAAVTPSIQSSYTTQQVGAVQRSVGVYSAYRSYQAQPHSERAYGSFSA